MMSWTFFVTALVVVLMPGTGVVYTVSCGLTQGRRAAVLAACGCTLGILPHLAASLLGLTAILHAGAVAFQAIKVAGALYLGFLAWGMWRDAAAPVAFDSAPRRKGAALILRAVAVNLLNPKLTVFFLAFLPQFVDPAAAEGPTMQMARLALIFMAMTLAVFAVYGLSAAAARRRVLDSPAIMRRLKRAFAGLFAALGLRLAFGE
jgi:threonine/homoserine/homoserine lactone efflux protein